MFNIGLTGGIGSGKSRVADMLGEWGASVVDTDEIARALTAAGGAAMPAIEREFGPGALTVDGALNRDWMRERAFADPQVRLRLEALLHPVIGQETERQAAAAQGPTWCSWCRCWSSRSTVGAAASTASAWSIATRKPKWRGCVRAAG